jgi:dihydrofolate reductase
MEAIYAIDSNNGLSKYGVIPWHSKKDLKFFSDKTKYNVVVMGKNTFFSLPDNVRPLRNRLNIVLTSNPTQLSHEFNKETSYNKVIFTNNFNICDSILKNRENYKEMFPYLSSNFKIYIIGGKNVYEQYIPLCETVWVTKLKKDYSCDLVFDYPLRDSKQFKEPEIIDEDDELTIYKYVKNIKILF